MSGSRERKRSDVTTELSQAVRSIVEYERQTGVSASESAVGRILSENSEASLQRLVSLGRKCSERLRYCLEIDRTIDRSKPTWQPVVVSLSTPFALRVVGMPDLPLHHTQSHVRHELSPKSASDPHLHGLTQHQIKRLPELLESPCAIWDNPAGKDGVLVLLDALDDDGLPLVAIIDPGVENRTTGLPCNFMKSVYGMERAFVRLSDAAETRRLLFCDPEKTKRLMSSSSLQLLGSSISLETNIRQTRKAVKDEQGHEQGKRRNESGGTKTAGKPGGYRGGISGRPPSEGRADGRKPSADRSRDCSPGRSWRSESRSKTH